MKKILFVFLIVLLPLACTTTPPGESPDIRRALDEVMERWISGLKSENLDLVMSAYWPEAELILASAEGEQVLQGFGSADFAELDVSEPRIEFDRGGPKRIYELRGPGFLLLNHFVFQERGGQWRIIHQVIEAPPSEHAEGPTIRVVSPLQAWADHDGNGVLEGPEVEEMLRALERLISEEHRVGNPLDEIFDLERDGHIDWADLGRARWIFVFEHFRHLYDHDPDLARTYDLNDDGVISNNEVWAFIDQLLEDERGLNVPHDSRHPADRQLDSNRDGFVDEGEIAAFHLTLLRTTASFPFEPDELQLVV